MRIRPYLNVYGDESGIRTIHEATNISGARIKHHTKVKARWGITGIDRPWSWATERVPIDIDHFDEEIKKLLSSHKAIFPIIRKHQGSQLAFTLQVVTQYDNSEDMRGLHLSAETVSLLNELGAAFDNDVVSQMTDTHPSGNRVPSP